MSGYYDRRPPEVRFWEKVDKSGDCWVWTAGKTGNGYGAFSVDGRLWRAHRYSMVLAGRPIPDDLLACHTCDNRACVNPDHIFAGTVQDNADDMKAKGRQPKAPSPEHRAAIVAGRRRYFQRHDGRHPATTRRKIAESVKRYAAANPRPRVTQCRHGHEYTPENTYINPTSGAKVCRVCIRARYTTVAA